MSTNNYSVLPHMEPYIVLEVCVALNWVQFWVLSRRYCYFIRDPAFLHNFILVVMISISPKPFLELGSEPSGVFSIDQNQHMLDFSFPWLRFSFLKDMNFLLLYFMSKQDGCIFSVDLNVPVSVRAHIYCLLSISQMNLLYYVSSLFETSYSWV